MEVKVERRVALEKPYEFLHFTLSATAGAELEVVEAGKSLRKLLDRIMEGEARVQTPTTPSNLDNLPWKDFSDGNGAWIFSNLEDPPAKELVAKLTEAKGKLDLDGFTYKLSGDNNQFVNRFHKKEK